MLTEQTNEKLVENVGGNGQSSGSNVLKSSTDEELNQLVRSTYEDKVPLSTSMVLRSSAIETVKKQIKRKMNREKKTATKKPKLKWKPKDCARPIGIPIRSTGDIGDQEKHHYQTFEFHKERYGLEDSVMLVPEDENQKLYVAIIKDIYVRKDGFVRLEVQWLYRPEDVEKRCCRDWNSKKAGDLGLFYSFHRDEVFAESVKRNCIVHFVPTSKKIPDHAAYFGYIVHNVYDFVKKTLRPLDYKGFSEMEKTDVDHFVEKDNIASRWPS